MKVSVPHYFGNTSKKPILPLVPEPFKSIKKEDLTTVNLCSDPTDHASTQVELSFKGLDGDNETPQEIIGWPRNVEQALIELDLCTGSNQYNVCNQFMRGSALSSFVSAAMVILVNKEASAIVHAEQARNNYPLDTDPAHDIGVFAGLRAAATTTTNRDALDDLTKAYGPQVVSDALNEVTKNLLPNKTLQHVKQ